MTQQELAYALNCSQSYVCKYEQCQKRLDFIEVRNICLALGVSFPEFIKEYEERIALGGIKQRQTTTKLNLFQNPTGNGQKNNGSICLTISLILVW